MKKTCAECKQEFPKYFFMNDICMHCAAESDVKTEAKKSTDYEVVEDKSCAGGACTL